MEARNLYPGGHLVFTFPLLLRDARLRRSEARPQIPFHIGQRPRRATDQFAHCLAQRFGQLESEIRTRWLEDGGSVVRLV